MPFTLAHPAAVLPLRRGLGRLGIPSALVVGSMVPDLAYFFPLGVTGSQSHSGAGLLWFCLPVGIAALVVFDWLVGPFTVAMLPSAVSLRLDPRSVGFNAQRLLTAGPAILVGAVTHVAWDSFTHSSGIAVQAFPALRAPVPLFPWYVPQVFTLLQHGSTLAGLALLTLWAVRWYQHTPPRFAQDGYALPRWLRSVVLVMLFLAPAVTAAAVLWPRLSASESSLRVVQQMVGRAVFAAGTAFLIALLLLAAAWRLRTPGIPRHKGA
jgi:hypothetical protein